MTARLSEYLLSILLAIGVTGVAAQAQSVRDPTQAQVCLRLESQLAGLDRGMTDPARADQVKRYEDAVSKQQFELDRMVAQGRRTGCEGSGFFLFGGGQSPQCVELNGQIQRLRAKLDRMMADLQRLQGTGSDRTEQRRGILSALADNDCGPQYRSAAPARPRGFFDALFGGATSAISPLPGADPSANPEIAQSSTYRTLCVRTCDGYYFPVSFATVPSRFQDDEHTCQRLCPAAEVALFTHRNPGEDVSHSVSISGKAYTSLPNAFHYRQEFTTSCSCKRPGQSWAEALGTSDETVERGDIVVTDEKSKAMSVPKLEQAKPSRPDTRKSKSDTTARGAESVQGPVQGAIQGSAQAASAAVLPDNTEKRAIRSVGPQFLPVR
jgi:Protein of unknown function (DUF2865)